jgi:hypothetical protein
MPKTIWSRNALPLVPHRFRSLYTTLLPAIDIGVIIFGLSSFLLGSRIVGDFTIPIFLPLWAGLILVGAICALIGLIFMLSRLELIGRFGVILGLLVYAGLTVLYIIGGSATSTLTLVLVAIRIVASLWRFFDLLGEMQREEAGKAVSTGEIPTRGPHRE